MLPRLRPVTADDRDLLLAIYASTREQELAIVGWDEAAKRAFVEQQFTSQDTYYRSVYSDRSFDVIELDGEPVGRLYLARFPGDVRIVDIALLPGHRNRGIATALLTDLARAADAAGDRLSAHVELGNPARSLYERLGFVAIEARGLHVLMERPPVVS